MTELTVGVLFDAAVRRAPDVAAVDSLPYSALAEWVARTADALADAGCRPGERVALVMRNSAEYLVGVLACATTGFVAVPVNVHLSPEEMAHIFRDAEVRAVLAHPEFRPRIDTALGEKTIPVLDPANLPSTRGGARTGWEPRPDDLLYLGYTSGTTGRPKGARVSHRNRVTAILLQAMEFRIGSGDTHLVVSPLYHTAPLTFALLHLCSGGSVIVRDRFEPAAVADLLASTQVTTTFMAPAALRRVLAADRPAGERLRAVIVGGAPFPRPLKEAALVRFGKTLYEFYGATEAGIITNLRPEEQTIRPSSVGRPLPGSDIEIRPTVQGDREIGEVWVRTATMCDGYQGITGTSEDGWIFLGDLGFVDTDGYLHLVDRISDIIISGGVNVYTREVEQVLETHPDVAEVAVFGMPDEEWGERVVAAIRPVDGRSPDESALAEYSATRLAGHKRPRRYVFVSDLPRSEAGKVLKRALHTHVEQRSHQEVSDA